MSKQRQLNELLIPKAGAEDTTVATINANWLKDLFQPDSIKDGQSIKNIEKIGGYSGLQNKLKTSLNKGIPNSSSDNQWRAKKFGTNDPIVKAPRTLMDMILATFEDETMKILCAAAILSLALGIGMHGLAEGWLEGASILLAVVIISGVTACNDYMKQKQFRKLNEIANRKNINVIRNGQTLNMSVYDLLVGDIALIQTGQILSVDGIVFKASKMSNDQSSITGESDLVKKQQFVLGGKKKCNPFLISGSRVMEGTGYMIVLAVGKNSREGINKQKLQQDSDQTPLQQKLQHLANQIGRLGMISAGLTFLALLIHLFIDTIQNDRCFFCLEELNMVVGYFIIAVSIIVIAVPQGLPLAVTISLAYSVGKMKDENNLVRFLSACQTMGGANNICTDKTGTLTKNLMTVTKFWSQGKVIDVFDKSIKITSKTLQMIGKGICVNSNAHPKIKQTRWQQIGNKTQCALLQMVYKFGYDFINVRKQIKVIETVPFSSDRKRMSAICKLDDGRIVIFSKGAPDFLLPSCSLYVDKDGIQTSINSDFKDVLFYNLGEFASHSLRTLLICYRVIKPQEIKQGYNPEDLQKNLTILGLAGIKDPLKEGIPQAVNSCKRAGIVVRMVTGDITQTAIAIAKDANILPANFQKPEPGKPGQFSVMEGRHFRERVEGLVKAADADKQYVKNMKQFTKIVKELRVLARSSPEDKYLLATGLKQMGHVVAMTGDGTNDAPALKKSDIGFAMGIAGTQVAKEAAGIILLDDNFGSIITAIKYGRNIFDCIRKFLQFQLTVNIVAIFMAFLGAVFIKQSPLTPVQMLWVNLIMDTLAALALATEPPSNQLLYRMPYSRTQKIITSQMWRFILVSALFQIIVLIVILFKGPQMFGVQSSIGLEKEHWNSQNGQHLSIFFDVFVFLQVFNFFNARKLSKDQVNVFSDLGNNYLFMIIVVAIFFCQLFIVQFGGRALMLVPLSFSQHFVCICIGLLSLVNGFVLKKFIPDGVFSCIPLLNENEITHVYDVDSELKKIWMQPATMRRSSKHRI